MKLEKISISKEIIDINFRFYFFIKELNSTILNITEIDINRLLEAYFSNNKSNPEQLKAIFIHIIETTIKSSKNNLYKISEKQIAFENLLFFIKSQLDVTSFIFALQLLQIKPLLLAEAKLIEIAELTNLQSINQLSIKYDTISKSRPYNTRVHGALLALLFFEKIEKQDVAFIAQSTTDYIESLCKKYQTLQKHGLEANQMFMLMFTESINQSIRTEAGASYEDRLFNVLINIGIKPTDIQKQHDSKDKSTEFDFYFNLNNKTVGISAKRTLRERYKQFLKTIQMSPLDLMIQISLGLDLTEEKAKTMRQYNVIIFVADEIYNTRKYLQKIDGVYSVNDLSLSLLNQLAKKT